MTLAYLPRLVCISLATCLLVHLVAGAAISLLARPAARLGERIHPRLAARCLLVLRLLPAGAAIFVVLVVCLPSYLWLEPGVSAERVGFVCLAAAGLDIAMWTFSILRGLRAVAGSLRFAHRCRCCGIATELPGLHARAWMLNVETPLLALSGIVRPRLVISRQVANALSAEELTVALRHELAHWSSRDNLKRLCMLLTPGLPLFGSSSQTLERGWRKFAEWAADDRAVGGSVRRSFALAAALVRLARMSSDAAPSPLALSLLGDDQQLSVRVERLLRTTPAAKSGTQPGLGLLVSGVILAAASLAAMLQPATLHSVHLALEHLIE